MTLGKLFVQLSQESLSPNQNRLIDHAAIDLNRRATCGSGGLNHAPGPCQLVNRRPICRIHSGYLLRMNA
jgi:hypothetical protein